MIAMDRPQKGGAVFGVGPEGLDFHPAAQLFPLLAVDSEEFGELVHDIAEHGLLESLVLCEGKVLDGRNRVRACQQLGIQPLAVDFTGEDPLAFALSKNLHRRHLTDDQRAAIAAEALDMFREQARKRQVAHGGTAPGRPSENTSPAVGEVSDRHAGDASAQAGTAFGVNRHKVERAAQVAAESPELLDRVKAGKIRLAEAEHAVRGGEDLAESPSGSARPPDEGPKHQFAFATHTAKELLHSHLSTLATGALQTPPGRRRESVETFRKLRRWVDQLLAELEKEKVA